MKTAVLGVSYGDEAKGRVVGDFCKRYNYDWAVRFSGGPNAGHTVYNNGKKYKFNHLPSGVAFGKKVALDAGMVINIDVLIEESRQLDVLPEIHISNNVHMITPDHILADAAGSGVGSTKRGISYVYADRALRRGTRIGEWKKKYSLLEHVPTVKFYDGLPPIGEDESALFEGAQGIMLDIDYGNYPYVTSSNIMPSSAHRIEKFVGVMKAYTTRVGEGPPHTPDMPELRERGKEFGTVTGRPRKCTWNDLQQIDYAISIVHPDEIVVTKLDILEGMKEIYVYDGPNTPICVGTLDDYKEFLLKRFPQIKWFSDSPDGDMKLVR